MTITVIIPVWNGEKNIETCLKSILGQTLVPDEIIVVDGSSTDSTLQLAKKYLRPQDTIVSETDRGPYDAMNKGVALAKGAIISILNSDDYWMPGTCKAVYEAFASASESMGIVHGDIEYIYKDGSSDIMRPAPRVLNYFCIGLPTNHPAAFVRKKVYEDVGYYDWVNYPICADQDFTYRAIGYGYELKYIPSVLTRMNTGGLSSRTDVSGEINRMLCKFKQPRKFLSTALRRLLGSRNYYYCGGFRNLWIRDIIISILTLGLINFYRGISAKYKIRAARSSFTDRRQGE